MKTMATCINCGGFGTVEDGSRFFVCDKCTKPAPSAATETPRTDHVISSTAYVEPKQATMIFAAEMKRLERDLAAKTAELEKMKAAIENAPWKASYMDMRNQRDASQQRCERLEKALKLAMEHVENKTGLDAIKWAVAWLNVVKPQCDAALTRKEPRT